MYGLKQTLTCTNICYKCVSNCKLKLVFVVKKSFSCHGCFRCLESIHCLNLPGPEFTTSCVIHYSKLFSIDSHAGLAGLAPSRRDMHHLTCLPKQHSVMEVFAELAISIL